MGVRVWVMRTMLVATIIMRMAMVMSSRSFAESTVGTNMVVICEVCFSVF